MNLKASKDHKRIRSFSYLLIALALGFSCQKQEKRIALKSETTPDFLNYKDEKAQVLLMGVFHFRDAGLDGYKPKYHLDVMSENRQREIEEITNALKEFNPTKIIIEVDANRSSKVDSLYNLYLQGNFELKSNEIFQIGFRLGKILNHKKLIAGDAQSMGTDGLKDRKTIAKEENLEYLLSSGYGDKFEKMYEYTDSLKTTMSLKDFLIYINEEKHQLKNHGHYILSSIGINNNEDYPKADALAAGWYSRNLRIFSNIRKSIKSKNDRVLVIFGNGHMPIIKHAVQASPEMKLVELKNVLK